MTTQTTASTTPSPYDILPEPLRSIARADANRTRGTLMFLAALPFAGGVCLFGYTAYNVIRRASFFGRFGMLNADRFALVAGVVFVLVGLLIARLANTREAQLRRLARPGITVVDLRRETNRVGRWLVLELSDHEALRRTGTASSPVAIDAVRRRSTNRASMLGLVMAHCEPLRWS